jgi:hypothetical protein
LLFLSGIDYFCYTSQAGKTRSPFDKLRANGGDSKNARDFPFMLSPSASSGQALSKHKAAVQ